MGHPRKPHVLLYMHGIEVEGVDYDVGPRNLRLARAGQLLDRKEWKDETYRLVIYSGHLGEDLKYVETV